MANAYKKSYKIAEKEMVSLFVTNVGFQKCEPLYQWGPGVRDHYILHHVNTGRGYYKVNNQTFELKAGDTFLIYPNAQTTYYADEEDPWEYYWVGFSGSDASLILRSTDFTKELPVVAGSADTSAIKNHVLEIYRVRGNDFVNAVEMTGKLYIMLSHFIRKAKKIRGRKDSYLIYAQKGVEYIARHYSYPITVDMVAGYVGISRSHLYRAFQLHTGVSPKEYLSEFRIRQACSLLKHSELSVTSIATSVGFDNNMYFSKAFRKVKGMSPTEYAKKHRY